MEKMTKETTRSNKGNPVKKRPPRNGPVIPRYS